MNKSNQNHSSKTLPIKQLTFQDILDVFFIGLSDFLTAPAFGLFFGSIFAMGGLTITVLVFQFGAYWILYPFVIGFALIGPFIAAGLYDVSRRKHSDLPLKWSEVLGVIWLQRSREFSWMAVVTLFIFWIWMYLARTLVAIFFGFQGFATFGGFIEAVMTTPKGWIFLLVGHGMGAIIALVLFCLTVISYPLLLDKNVDFVTAMITSINVVCKSPAVMLTWGVFVVSAVVISAIPAFTGLLITLPVLGHATWHLYTRATIKNN
ncbi:MAG TPA: hypothetical protein TECP_00282 [Hyphomicrobiaceae bacterium MAG_BT-2024]